jgi:hypothetical protein
MVIFAAANHFELANLLSTDEFRLGTHVPLEGCGQDAEL